MPTDCATHRPESGGSATAVAYDADGRARFLDAEGAGPVDLGYQGATGTVLEEGTVDVVYSHGQDLFVGNSAAEGSPGPITVSGSLAAAEGQTLTAPSYELTVGVGAGTVAATAGYRIDGDAADFAECASACPGFAQSFTIYPEELSPGEHVLTAFVASPGGQERTRAFRVTVPEPAPYDGPADEGVVPLEAQLPYAAGLRQAFGLRSDETWLAARESNPGDIARGEDWGFAVTEAEAGQIDDYVALGDDFEIITEYGEAQASNAYAGAYMNPATSTIHLGFTRDMALHRNAVEARFAHDSALRFFAAQRTRTQLEQTRDRVEGDLHSLAALDIRVAWIGISERRNQVEVGVEDLIASEELVFAAKYGPAVRVAESRRVFTPYKPGRYGRHRPLLGGISLGTNQDNPFCTMSFGGRRTGNRVPHRYYAFTAGHCAEAGEVISQGGKRVGRVDKSTYENGSRADAARFRTTAKFAPRRIFKRRGQSLRITRVRRSRSAALQSDGAMVCLSGGRAFRAVTNKSFKKIICGFVLDGDVTYPGAEFYPPGSSPRPGTPTMKRQAAIDFDLDADNDGDEQLGNPRDPSTWTPDTYRTPLPGDSGGPLYTKRGRRGAAAYGTFIAGGPGFHWASHAYFIEAQHEARILTVRGKRDGR